MTRANLVGLLDRNIGGFCPAQNLVDQIGRTLIHTEDVRSVRDQTFCFFDIVSKTMYERQSRAFSANVLRRTLLLFTSGVGTHIKCVSAPVERIDRRLKELYSSFPQPRTRKLFGPESCCFSLCIRLI